MNCGTVESICFYIGLNVELSANTTDIKFNIDPLWFEIEVFQKELLLHLGAATLTHVIGYWKKTEEETVREPSLRIEWINYPGYPRSANEIGNMIGDCIEIIFNKMAQAEILVVIHGRNGHLNLLFRKEDREDENEEKSVEMRKFLGIE